ncbi:MAG: ROK family protein [Pseudomonadota bacterium]
MTRADADHAAPGGVRIGVDLGGTKIEALALDRTGAELSRRRISTPQDGYEPIIAAVAALIEAVAADAGAAAYRVGIGAPGSMSPASGHMRNGNTTALNGRPMAADLAKAIDAPLRIANDANCLAMSEAADGAGAGASSVFGVIIGTGVGGGLVHAGRLIEGANGIAGEWGHLPMPGASEGRKCWCGRVDCIETWLSGPAFEADYARAAGATLTAKEIAARAEVGDPVAGAALARYAERFGLALSVIVNSFDPEVVVLGGGMSNVGALYPATTAALRPHVFSDHVATRIVRNRHGDSSGVRGAAWLWPAGDQAEEPASRRANAVREGD